MTKRRIILIFLLVTLQIILSGCGKFGMNLDLNIDEKGSGNFTYKLIGEGIFAKIMNEDEELKHDSPNNIIFNKNVIMDYKMYTENNKTILEAKIDFKSIEEFNKLFKSTYVNDFSLEIIKKHSFLWDKYLLKIRYPKSFNFNNDTSKSNNDFELFSEDDINSFLNDNVFINIKVNLPWNIKKHNFIKSEGKSLEINQSLGQIKPSQLLTVEGNLLNKTNIYIAASAIILLILLVLFLVFKNRKTNNNLE